tara:strand:+ start:158 stop:415 length:258 start_codon:yes stop_codon:yes gene_type:complete
MSSDLFQRIKSLLLDHVQILNEHSIGDTHVDDAQAIIDEINILLKSGEVKNIENQIDETERKLMSEDLADEILNSKYCVGGSCED